MITEVARDLMGSQVPCISCVPEFRNSLGDAAIELAAMAGLHLDPWQQWVVRNALGQTEELYFNPILGHMIPKSAAYEIGLVVARQNGKGSIMEALELAWLYLAGARTIVHSAHEFATSKEHFQRLESLISNTPELKGELARGGIKWSHGDESVNLANGQRLLFKTRTKGAARGFSIDKLVMDEAMYLKEDAVRAMTYATSARPDVQIMYAGSAGHEESFHFGRVRDRGIAASDPRLFYAEWSADVCTVMCTPGCEEHDDPKDPAVWAKTNPALGYRLQAQNLASELAGDPEGFLVERLSVGNWPKRGEAWAVIPKAAWEAREDQASSIVGKPTFSVDVSPDTKQQWSCIAAVGEGSEGGVHGEITGQRFAEGARMDYRPGVKWVVPRILEINKRQRGAVWIIDKGTQAGAFIPELEKHGVKIHVMNAREHAQACGEFYASIVPRGDGPDPDFWHIGQEEMQTAVANAAQRKLADMWAWDRQSSVTDITPIVAMTNASWGHRLLGHKKRPKPMAAWGR